MKNTTNDATFYPPSHREYALALFFAAVFAFFILLDSPLHPLRFGGAYTDSSVFKTVALMMTEGFAPYQASFDHKGPLIYLINWLGIQIAYYRGVWCIELVFITGTFFLLYAAARLAVSAMPAILAVLSASTLLVRYLEGGNLTEEYAMLFIALSLYFFLDYLLHKRTSPARILLSGAAFACVCLLRPNMTAVWIVLCPVILWTVIRDRNWKQCRQFICCFLLGTAAALIPVLVWLYARGCLAQCINDYIIFNARYCADAKGFATIPNQFRTFLSFATSPVYLAALCGLLLSLKKRPFVHGAYAVLMFLALLLLCLSGREYPHYGMALIPLAVYPLSLILGSIGQKESLLLAALVCSFIVKENLPIISSFPKYYAECQTKQRDPETTHVVDIVRRLTKDTDKISVYGNWDTVYALAKRMHATRYSYQFPIGQVYPRIMDEYMTQLQNELPPVIVIQKERYGKSLYDDRIKTFLTKNDYHLVWPDKLPEEGAAPKSPLIFQRSVQ